jgi:hypothetical protein
MRSRVLVLRRTTVKEIEIISVVFAVALAMGGSAYAYDNTSLSGTITCNSAVSAGANSLANGQIALVADGQGTWRSGSASYQRADGATCNYVLRNGAYAVNADGSGSAIATWKLVRTSSSSSCVPVVRGAASTFSLSDQSFTWSGAGNLAESGTCKFGP